MVGGYSQSSPSDQSPKRIYLLDQGYGRGGYYQFSLPGQSQKRVYLLDQIYGRGVPPIFTTVSKLTKGMPLFRSRLR